MHAEEAAAAKAVEEAAMNDEARTEARRVLSRLKNEGESSQEAYDNLHIGDPAAAQKLQDKLKEMGVED